jgi:crotonobetainyl-CoA:carnitine CoA-transferase CaiB-like acyl-CoA transferase
MGPLDGILVLDLTTTRGEFAGRVLADLGAEVIKIEPPEGADARRLPPFVDGLDGHPESSLFWSAVALGKHSVTLDLATPEGRERMRDLVRDADVLIESFAPGTMEELGLGYRELSALNPHLVFTSITPFGQEGPLARAPATDLTIEAAGGLLGLQGDGDRPPVPMSLPQASFHAGTQAAADTIIALNERELSGLGQHLDVSMQACVVWVLMNATGYPPMVGRNPPGTSEHRNDPPNELVPGLRLRRMWPCADGHVVLGLYLPGTGGRTLQALVEWGHAEGAVPSRFASMDFMQWRNDVASGKLSAEDLIAAIEAVEEFVASKPKSALQHFAVKTKSLLAAVNTTADLLSDPHLRARDFWTEIEGRIYPGAFARLSRTPIALGRRAPRRGEHDHLLVSTRRRSRRQETGATPEGAFEGVRVADFAWVGVGPIISKGIADHGATVVRVESGTRPDVLRLLPPFKNGEPGLDRSHFQANFNTSKLGMALNLARSEGREIARRLIDWADVVVESFTPGTMARFGLDYASLARERPDLVMLSTCMRGQTGPEASYTGFGNQGAALAGLIAITGWPDRPPAGPWGAYTDFIAPRYGIAALAAAILHRRRTGMGQHIDLSQIEAGIQFGAPLVLDYTVNGRVAGPIGHDSPYGCPHGVFRTAGDERYVAIGVESDLQWRALCDAFAWPEGMREWGDEKRFAERRRIHEQLNRACVDEDCFALAERLREVGVPAHAVARPTDLYDDQQLASRQFFVTLEHGEIGAAPFDGLATRFSRAKAGPTRAAPLLGEHAREVMGEILGYTDAEIEAYQAAGVLE